MQKKSFDAFMKNDFHYVVFSNARPEVLDTLYGKPTDTLIQQTCEELGVEHIAIPQEIHQGDLRVGTWKHMDCLDWAVRNYPDIEKYDYVWISDSDTFLLEPFDVEDFMQGYDFAGMPIFSNHVKYYRPQLIIYPQSVHKTFIQYRMRTDYRIEGEEPDGCGSLYLMFKDNPNLKIREIRQTFCKHGTPEFEFIPYSTTGQQVSNHKKNMLKNGIHSLLYTDQQGIPTYTKEEHREFIHNCNLPEHVEKYADDMYCLATESPHLSRNHIMNEWDWRGNYFDGLKFYHYSEGSNWDNKPVEYHIRRSKILSKLIDDTIKKTE